MRDVRGVFIGFFLIAVAAATAGLAVGARRRDVARAHAWRAMRSGAVALITVLLVGGVVSFVAFDVLFETFHRLFFAGGSYTFDPATERLVQLFPFRFWQETAIAVGAVCVVVASAVVVLATRRAAAIAAVAGAADETSETDIDAPVTDAHASLPAAGRSR
jgi:integral membrane protein (TIGR01906 family)